MKNKKFKSITLKKIKGNNNNNNKNIIIKILFKKYL